MHPFEPTWLTAFGSRHVVERSQSPTYDKDSSNDSSSEQESNASASDGSVSLPSDTASHAPQLGLTSLRS
jgi:hypothetical protein